jgi:hypothetical protein
VDLYVGPGVVAWPPFFEGGVCVLWCGVGVSWTASGTVGSVVGVVGLVRGLWLFLFVVCLFLVFLCVFVAVGDADFCGLVYRGSVLCLECGGHS